MSNRLSRIALVALTGAALAAGAHPTTADAAISPFSEPAYTRTATNNVYWWDWQAVNGLNYNGSVNYLYYLCYKTRRDGVLIEDSNGLNGPTSQNCFTLRTATSSTPVNGLGYTYPGDISQVLADGAAYQMCATGYHFVWPIYTLDSYSGWCLTSRIDRSAPSIGVQMAGGKAVTNDPQVPLRIDYADAISPPWNGADGRASNWTCVGSGGSCTVSSAPDPNCSVPAAGFNNRNNRFDCAADLNGQPDGVYGFCARAADAAVLDNPSGPDQFVATSASANISPVACATTMLDRAGPTVTATASATTVFTGDLVSFSAQATDAIAGISGAFDWDFGDATAHGAGAAVSHTFMQTGTYRVRVTTADGAGNPGEGAVTIVVNPRSTSGTSGATATSDSTTGAQTRSTTAADISKAAGGGGTQKTRVAGLDVIAPKQFRAGRKTLVLAVTAPSAGKLTVALLKGTRVRARKGAAFRAAGTYTVRVPVPAKLARGTYRIKLTFTPKSAKRATTKSLKLKVVAAAAKKTSARQATLRGTRPARVSTP